MADTSFFPQERYLLELYARYAASALDGATALDEAKRGHEARALLELARALAAATTGGSPSDSSRRCPRWSTAIASASGSGTTTHAS